MQLKTVGQSLSALNSIQNILNDTSLAGTRLNLALANSLSTYSIETVKAAIAQGTFTAEQIKAILSAKGLTDAEIQEVITTNALTASQTGATASTLGLGNAFKGLGASMKAFALSNPILTAIAAIGITIYGAVKAYDALTVSVEEANEAMEEAVSDYESAKSNLESINSELEEQNKRIDELLSKDKLTYAEKGELEELQEITKELLLQQDIEERRMASASKEAAGKTLDAYQKQYGNYNVSKKSINEKIESETFPMAVNENDIMGNIAAYTRAKEELEEAKNELHNVSDKEEIKWFESDIQDYIDVIDDYSEQLDNNIADLQEKRLALEDAYNKAIEKRKAGTEPLTSSEKEIISTYDSIYNAIKLIYEYTNQNDWNNMEIENIFNTEGIEKTKDELIKMAKAGELSPETIKSYGNLNKAIQNSELFLEDGQKAAEAFCDEILAASNAGKELSEATNKYPTSSFEDAWASLAATDNDSLKSLKDDLLELAEAGQLTFETFNETEGSGDFLAQLGLTPDNISDVDDIISKINELKSSADQLASMKKGISPLSENLYSKQQEPDKEISVDVFAGMDEGLKKQKKEWENYVTVLGNASSSTEAVQKATNELATAYVNSNNFLANLSEANRDYYVSQLSAMGVENAEEVVTASLSAQKEILAIKEQALAVTKDGVTASTAGEINALLNEANASETTRAYLFQLTAAEQVFNNQSLDTSGKIRALGELATAYGQTAIAAKIAAWEQAAADSHTQSSYSEADLKHLQEEMNANISATKIDVNPYAGSVKSGGSGSGKSGKSGSSEKEESIETFDFIETAIKRIEAAIERLKTKAEETFRSFASRGREYKKAISEIAKEIEIQRQGYDAYIAKANSVGLEESWASQVRDGNINIADVSDDGLKERIKNYKEWWNHATLFSNG